MVDFFKLKKELIINGQKYHKHQLIVPTLKHLQKLEELERKLR